MKRILVLIALVIALLAPASLVHAEDVLTPVCSGAPAEATLCEADDETQEPGSNSIYGPNGILTKAARLVSILVGVVAVIMIIVGGFQYVLSSGDSTNVQNAKNTILYAMIGLVVAVSAQLLISFVLTKL